VLAADLGGGIIAGFTRVADGNLALHVGDDPAQVARRRLSLAEQLGVPVWFGRQVHGTRVLDLDAETRRPAAPAASAASAASMVDLDDGSAPGGVDALVATRTGIGLGVLIADCVPVLLADPGAGVIAVAHAGRVGLLAGVIAAVVDAMTAKGARADGIRVALGPAAGPCCYEVPDELRRAAESLVPALGATTSWGTPSLDLRAGVAAALADRGVRQVALVGGCTIEDPESFSYRRSRRRGVETGRCAGVVAVRSSAQSR
jgi:polyphenol oxidase